MGLYFGHARRWWPTSCEGHPKGNPSQYEAQEWRVTSFFDFSSPAIRATIRNAFGGMEDFTKEPQRKAV